MVSIIVPVYNAEKTLRKCVASILAQRYVTKEIILVNDGSKDASITILRDLESRHTEITVIDKENGGVSSARNAGLKICTGDYVTFVDSDDYYLSDTYLSDLQKLLTEDVDLAVSGYTVLTGNKKTEYFAQVRTEDIHALASNYWSYRSTGLLNSPCNKLFRREQIQDYFCEQMKMGEDAVFVMQYLKNCKKIAFGESCGYGYVCENTSSTATYRQETAYDMAQSRIYHCAMHDFWTSVLPADLVARNYIEMRTDETFTMLYALLNKKGIMEYLQRNVKDVLTDTLFTQYASSIDTLPKSYPHKLLSQAIASTNQSKAKAYCLCYLVKRKLCFASKSLRKRN